MQIIDAISHKGQSARVWGSVLIAPILVWLIFSIGCSQSEDKGADLKPHVILGDVAVTSLAERIFDAYESDTSSAQFDLRITSRPAILAALQSQKADGAIMLHPPASSGYYVVILGQESLAVIVNPSLPPMALSSDLLRAVFSGKVIQWEAPDRAIPIHVAVLAAPDSWRTSFDDTFLKGVNVSSNARISSTITGILEFVRGTEGAIGYLPANSADDTVRILAIDGVSPPRVSQRLSSYPLTSTIAFVSKSLPDNQMSGFLSWLLNRRGQQIIREYEGGSD